MKKGCEYFRSNYDIRPGSECATLLSERAGGGVRGNKPLQCLLSLLIKHFSEHWSQLHIQWYPVIKCKQKSRTIDGANPSWSQAVDNFNNRVIPAYSFQQNSVNIGKHQTHISITLMIPPFLEKPDLHVENCKYMFFMNNQLWYYKYIFQIWFLLHTAANCAQFSCTTIYDLLEKCHAEVCDK